MILLGLLLAAAPAQSNAILWGGAPTHDEAQVLFEAWSKDAAKWSGRLRLHDGYPRLVKSDDVPGLRPGFHVVLLGICNAQQVRPRTRVIKELYPNTYWRPLTTTWPDECPEQWCSETDDMIAVPAGEFVTGCDKTGDQPCGDYPEESKKQLASFQMDRAEISVAMYQTCVARKECSALLKSVPTDPRLPALVNYSQAWAYCAAQGKRLVHTDEWEKAARGPDGRRFPWGARKPDCSMGNWAECGPLKPTGGFVSWASPYGALDMFGNATEWTDGPVRKHGSVSEFPSRGWVLDAKSFGLWQTLFERGTETFGFRCARACVWPEDKPPPSIPLAVDTQLDVPVAYAAVANVRLRDALEQWRKDRAGDGGVVEWQEPFQLLSTHASSYVRETIAGLCMEGPVTFKVYAQVDRVELSVHSGGAIACCDATCESPTPAAAMLRFVEAHQANDSTRLRAFIPASGLHYELQINDDSPTKSKVTKNAAGLPSHFSSVERDDLVCDADWNVNGEATCSGHHVEVVLKRVKNAAVVMKIWQQVIEGC